jgi:hypothetical protein
MAAPRPRRGYVLQLVHILPALGLAPAEDARLQAQPDPLQIAFPSVQHDKDTPISVNHFSGARL